MDESYYKPIASETPLQFARTGLQHRLFRKLRQGRIPREAILDLHGLTLWEAEEELHDFLLDCQQEGKKCVRIIHGKGKSTPDQPPILKNMVNNALRDHANVVGFCSAKSTDGGTGAVYVLLKSSHRSDTR